METTLKLNSFDVQNQRAVVFSLYESMNSGEAFRIISDTDPSMLKTDFEKARIENFKWEQSKLSSGDWEVRIQKLKSSAKSGCCGGCS